MHPIVPRRIFVANVDENVVDKTLEIVKRLRKGGINCQTDLMGRDLGRQLKYADSLGIPYVVIVGEKELKENKFKLKDMKNKTEEEMSLESVVEFLKGSDK